MDETGNIRKGPDSQCYIENFFKLLNDDCKTKIDSFFQGKSKLYDFIQTKTIGKWEKTRFGYGFPVMQSEGWLLQVVVGALVKSCVAHTLAHELQTLREEPEIITIDEKKLDNLGSRYTSRYMVWDKHSENIVLCIDTLLSSLGKKINTLKHLPSRKPDVTLLIDNKISLLLETKMGYGNGVNSIKENYERQINELRPFSINNLVQGLIVVEKTTEGKKRDLQGLPLVNDDETMKKLMNSICQAVCTRLVELGARATGTR